MPRAWQYQALAEPIAVSTVPPPAPTVQPLPHQPAAKPLPHRLRPPAPTGDPGLFEPEAAGLDKWRPAPQGARPLPPRPRPQSLPAVFDPALFAAPEEITLDKWKGYGDPPPRPKPGPSRGLFAYGGETTLYGTPPELSWWRPASEPTRQKPRQPGQQHGAHQGEPSDWPPPEDVTLDRWFREAAIPRHPPSRPKLGTFVSGIEGFDFGLPPLIPWYVRPNEPARQPPRLPRQQHGAFVGEEADFAPPEEVTPDRFSTPLPVPRRLPPWLRPAGMFFVGEPIPPFPDAEGPDKWWRPADLRGRAVAPRVSFWAGILEPSLYTEANLSWLTSDVRSTHPKRTSAYGICTLPIDPLGILEPVALAAILTAPPLPRGRPRRFFPEVPVAHLEPTPVQPPVWGTLAAPDFRRPHALRLTPSFLAPPVEALSTVEGWHVAPAGARPPRRRANLGLFAGVVDPSSYPAEVIPLSWQGPAVRQVVRQVFGIRPLEATPILVSTPAGWEFAFVGRSASVRQTVRHPAIEHLIDPATLALPPALPWLASLSPPPAHPPRRAAERRGVEPPEWLVNEVQPESWWVAPWLPRRLKPRHKGDEAAHVWLYAPTVVLPGRWYRLRWSYGYPIELLWNEAMAIDSEITVNKGEDAILHFSHEDGPRDIAAWTLACMLSRRVGLSPNVTPLFNPTIAPLDAREGTYTVTITSAQLQTTTNAGKFELDVWRDDSGLRTTLARVKINVKPVARW